MQALLKYETWSHKDVIAQLKGLLSKEKEVEAEILLLLREVKHRKLYALAGYPTLAEFCVDRLGLSEDAAWKRSQAVNVISFFPWTFESYLKNEIKLSHLAMLAPKITQANEDQIRAFIPNKSKAELKIFLDRINHDGTANDIESKIELKIRCKKELLEKLHKVRTLKAKTKFLPELDEVLEDLVDLWLSRNDPEEKAKRSEKKANATIAHSSAANCTGATEQPCVEARPESRRYIPAPKRHHAFIKADYSCEYKGPDGKRCGSKYKLQIDHIVPFSHHGTHSSENLQILCAVHNQLMADIKLGRQFMDNFRN